MDLTFSTRFFGIAFLVTAMLAVGLEVTGREIAGAWREPRLLARAALASLVLVPALCWIVARLVPLREDFDILAEAGEPRTAVTKTFLGPVSGGRLVLDFTPVQGDPLVSNIKIIRQ